MFLYLLQAGHSKRDSSHLLQCCYNLPDQEGFFKIQPGSCYFQSIALSSTDREIYASEKNSLAPTHQCLRLSNPFLLIFVGHIFWGSDLSSLFSSKLCPTDSNPSQIALAQTGWKAPGGAFWEMRNQCGFSQMFPKSCYPGTKTKEGHKQGSFCKIFSATSYCVVPNTNRGLKREI